VLSSVEITPSDDFKYYIDGVSKTIEGVKYLLEDNENYKDLKWTEKFEFSSIESLFYS